MCMMIITQQCLFPELKVWWQIKSGNFSWSLAEPCDQICHLYRLLQRLGLVSSSSYRAFFYSFYYNICPPNTHSLHCGEGPGCTFRGPPSALWPDGEGWAGRQPDRMLRPRPSELPVTLAQQPSQGRMWPQHRPVRTRASVPRILEENRRLFSFNRLSDLGRHKTESAWIQQVEKTYLNTKPPAREVKSQWFHLTISPLLLTWAS